MDVVDDGRGDAIDDPPARPRNRSAVTIAAHSGPAGRIQRLSPYDNQSSAHQTDEDDVTK
jgi:hypothetical protein